MTVRGRTQAYSVGNKTYGFGRSNPTSGPVDKLGYRERDAKKMLVSGAVKQALARRASAGQRATDAAQVAAQRSASANQAIAPAVRPNEAIGPLKTAIANAAGQHTNSVPTPVTYAAGHPAGSEALAAPQRITPAPNAGAGPMMHNPPAAQPQFDISANNSHGVALTDAQRNSQQMNMNWDTAHGMQPVAYDQMFSQPYTEINGQVVPNPAYRGPAVPYAGPGAVNGQTPVQAQQAQAQAAATQAMGQGIEGLGYDPEYAQFLAQYQLQNSAASQALFNGTHNARAQAGVQERQIDQQAPKIYDDLTNNFASRGMGFSGAYGGAYGEAQNGVANQHAQVQQNLNDLLNSLQTNYGDTIGSGQQNAQLAMQQYIASLAGNAGSLGLASGNAVTGPTGDASSQAIQALLAQLLGIR